MAKTFSKMEQEIVGKLSVGTSFKFYNKTLTVIKVGKPLVSAGECKTDIYILAKDKDANNVEFKISYKKENADFIENKIKAERAEELFGPRWAEVIKSGTQKFSSKFESREIIIKTGTRNGSITLGWKYELLDKKSGKLSEKLDLTKEQIVNVYSGENLPNNKKDASVDGEVIANSGVANYMLRTDELSSAQKIIDQLQTIDEYVEEHPDVFFACKALNYRTFDDKYDGDRPLAVQIDWEIVNNKLVAKYDYNHPLSRKGNEMKNKLADALKKLGIENTDDITSVNSDDSVISRTKL